MQTTVVTIRDQVSGLGSTLIYTKAHKDRVRADWERPDPLLTRLQHYAPLAGRYRLADLDPFHFRLLLAYHMGLVADLGEVTRLDPADPTVRSMDRLFVGLVLALERRTEGSVSVLTVTRLSEANVLYDVSLSLEAIDIPAPKRTGLRVVVDNLPRQ